MPSITGTANDVRVGAVLFTDLVGFTNYTDVVGDAGALAVLEQQEEMVSAVLLGRPGARLVKELGDGMMLWFDSASAGLECATILLTKANAARAAGTFPLAVRMGIHHGEVIARGDDLVGQTVNIAARVSDLAGPGELLASEGTVDACGETGPGVDLEPVGPATVKGVLQPIWLHRLVL